MVLERDGEPGGETISTVYLGPIDLKAFNHTMGKILSQNNSNGKVCFPPGTYVLPDLTNANNNAEKYLIHTWDDEHPFTYYQVVTPQQLLQIKAAGRLLTQ